MKTETLHIVVVIEPGTLELQVELLLHSLTKLSTRPPRTVWVINPQALPLSPQTYEMLERYGVCYVEENLNILYSAHRLTNKVYACAYVEKKVEGRILFLDSDILALNNLDLLDDVTLRDKILVKPAHSSAVVSGEQMQTFWRYLLTGYEIHTDSLWQSRASGEVSKYTAYYNTGVIAAPTSSKLFASWLEMFEQLPKIYPTLYRELLQYPNLPKYPYRKGRDLCIYHIGQILFALTLFRHYSRNKVVELPIGYNYPLPRHKLLGREAAANLEDITLLHYHGALADPLWFTVFNYREEFMAKVLSILT